MIVCHSSQIITVSSQLTHTKKERVEVSNVYNSIRLVFFWVKSWIIVISKIWNPRKFEANRSRIMGSFHTNFLNNWPKKAKFVWKVPEVWPRLTSNFLRFRIFVKKRFYDDLIITTLLLSVLFSNRFPWIFESTATVDGKFSSNQCPYDNRIVLNFLCMITLYKKQESNLANPID